MPLTKTPTIFFKDYIEDNTDLTFNDDLYAFRDPDSPDDMVRLSGESGFREPYQNAYSGDWAGLMVRVRGKGTWPELTIWTIHNLLVGYGQVLSDDFFLVTTWCQGEPQQVEIDSDGRVVMTAHYLADIQWTDATNRTSLYPVIGQVS